MSETKSGPSRGPIRVMIVDDHTIVRRGARALLSEIDGIDVVGEAADGAEAIQRDAELKADVILMDLVMPGMAGSEAIERIMAKRPDARILVMTSFISTDNVFPAIKAGALGYLLKDCEPQELVTAIQRVHAGEPSLHPSIALMVLDEFSHPAPTKSERRHLLTEREIDVLRQVARGLSNQQIADELEVAEVTVRTHVSRILHKLHLSNRVQATLYALREGLASVDD